MCQLLIYWIVLKLQKIYSHFFNSILDLAWPKSMKLTLEQQFMLSVLHMPADALATLGVRVSAGMVLTPEAGIFRLHHQKS